MKHLNKQNLTLNALLILFLALFIVAGLLMWSQHNRYHNYSTKQTLWTGQEYSQGVIPQMEENHSIKE